VSTTLVGMVDAASCQGLHQGPWLLSLASFASLALRAWSYKCFDPGHFGAIISRNFGPCCGLAATIAFQAES